MGIHNAGVATHNQRTDLTFIASKAPNASKTDSCNPPWIRKRNAHPFLAFCAAGATSYAGGLLQINHGEISPAIWAMVCQQQ
jgi:hypothetical protein